MKHRIKNASLASKIRYSYLFFFVPLFLFLVFAISMIYGANVKYSEMIQSATLASKFGLEFKDEFDYNTYLLIVGNQTIEETNLYGMLDEANEIADSLEKLTITTESRERLTAVKKYLMNLRKYIGRIEENLEIGDKYEENMQIWETDVQIVTSLLSESMNEYLYLEIQNIQKEQIRNEDTYLDIINVLIIIMLVFTIGLIVLSFFISESIASPIRELNQVTKQVAKGELSVRASIRPGTEVQELGTSLNEMIEKIQELLDKVTKEQSNLREAELELLQSQINPHFLYNTLDTIVWLAETGNQKQVVDMVESLSDFFRISLNNGKELITIEEELSHVNSYLEIQQIRYRDIMTYEIQADDSLNSYLIPKISLQPIVENALYHGIKNKRGQGMIRICSTKSGEDMKIEIEDNGIGMTEQKLKAVREAVLEASESQRNSFGLYNVNERIRLKFGVEYGLGFESTYGEGTKVTLTLPCKTGI